MSGIVLNEMVTKYTLRVGKQFKMFDKHLKTADKQADKSVSSQEKRFQKGYKRIADLISKHMRKAGSDSTKSMNNAASSASKHFNNAAQKVRRSWASAASGLANVNQQIARSASRGANKSASAYEKAGARISRSIRNTAMLALGGYSAGRGASRMFEDIKSQESILAALQAKHGSRAAAIAQYNRDYSFANRYGQDSDETSKSRLRLANLDLDSSDKAMLAYANIASANPGKTANDFVEAVADAVTGEFERLKEFGIKGSQSGDVASFRVGNKTYTGKNDGAGIEKLLQQIAMDKYAGNVDLQANTLPGLLTKLNNRIKKFSQITNSAAFGSKNGLFQTIFQSLDKFLIWYKEALPQTIEKIAAFGKAAKKYFPIVAAGVGLVTANYIGLKAIAAGMWVFKAIKAMKALRVAALVTQATAFALPIAIGAAIGAIGYVGYTIYKYFQDGDKALEGIRAKFPIIADAIKYVAEEFRPLLPELRQAGQIIKEGLVWGFEAAVPVAKWLFKEVLIPTLAESLRLFGRISKWIKTAYDYWMPKLVTSFYFWKDTISEIKANFVNFFNFLDEKFAWLKSTADAVGGVIGRAFDWVTGTGNQGGTLTNNGLIQSGGQSFRKNHDLADKLVSLGAKIYTGANRCLEGVWKTQKAAMGVSKITAYSAADAAPQLAADKRFKEIKVTYDMYKRAMAGDQEMMSLLHGAQVIYDRQSGFSKKHGHAETWDMKNKKSLYGMGPRSLNRSQNMINHARVFVPAQQVPTQSVTAASNGSSGMSYTPSMSVNAPITINMGSNASPQAVGRETERALTSATSKIPALTGRQ